MSAADMAVTGAIMGVVHVLAGPEHLSAMATLAGMDVSETDGGARRRCESFSLGIRWGVGHGLGLAAASFVLISAESVGSEWIAVDYAWAMTMESLTGMFMILLGAYGMHKAKTNRDRNFLFAVPPAKPHGMIGYKPRRKSKTKTRRVGTAEDRAGGDDEENVEVKVVNMPPPPSEEESTSSIARMMEDVLELDSVASSLGNINMIIELDDEDDSRADDAANPPPVPPPGRAPRSKSFVEYELRRPPVMRATALVGKHANEGSLDASSRTGSVSARRGSGGRGGRGGSALDSLCGVRNVLAVVAGAVHGVSGPGGVLGVVPAVQLRDAGGAATYLGVFCLTATLVMGGFATAYASFCDWLAGEGLRNGRNRANRVFSAEFGSAFLSVCVGIIWMLLIAAGELQAPIRW